MTIPNHDITKLKADLVLAERIRDSIPPGTHGTPSASWLKADAKVSKIHAHLQEARRIAKEHQATRKAPSTKMFMKSVGTKDERLVPLDEIHPDKR